MDSSDILEIDSHTTSDLGASAGSTLTLGDHHDDRTPISQDQLQNNISVHVARLGTTLV